jgi:hypothetical protein
MPDPVADLHLGLKELAAEDRDGWTPLGLSDRLRDVVGLHEAGQVELIRSLALWDRRTAWAEDGALTAVSWLKHQLDMTGPEAAGWVRLSRHYGQHRAVRDALDGGQLTVAKVRVLVRAEKGREAMFAACVEGLVGYGCEYGLPFFTEILGDWAEAVDDDEPPDPTKRSWRTGVTGDLGSGRIEGSADDVAIMNAAIEALDTLDPIDCPEGPRTREQRHHDIVIDIFRRVLADKLGDDPQAVGGLDIVIDADLAADLVAQPSDTPELDLSDPLPEVLRPYRDGETDGILRRCHRPDGARARKVIAAALLCTGLIRRILIDPTTGQPIDVGRAYRRFTPRQQRALAIRDGGCVFPGCDRRPKWCDAHHLRPWEDGGHTDLDNGVLLCRRHHTLIHHKGWSLERNPRTGVVTATAPDGRQFTRRPGRRC